MSKMYVSGLRPWLVCVMGATALLYGIIGAVLMRLDGPNDVNVGLLISSALQASAILVAWRGWSPAAFALSIAAFVAPTVSAFIVEPSLVDLVGLYAICLYGGPGSLVAAAGLYGPARSRLLVQPRLARKLGEPVCPRTISGEHQWTHAKVEERGVTRYDRACVSCGFQAKPEVKVETWRGGAAIAQAGRYQADLKAPKP